ncbi:energy transducer TonB [Alteromonas aestuariivivens]|nr:energy transducer TonB [Alteromonas aestuariivivens]
MHTITYSDTAFIHGVRLLTHIAMGVAITFGLFVLMAKLIENNDVGSVAPQAEPIGPIILAIEDPETITKDPIKPREKPVTRPQTPRTEVEITPNQIEPHFSLVPPGIGNSIEIKPEFGAGASDMAATPQLRVDPSYPPEAARDGIEGWVKLGFSITASGGVADIVVLDAEPKRIFDRAAKKALSKWKYKPKMENGSPVSQSNMYVLLEFNLNQ